MPARPKTADTGKPDVGRKRVPRRKPTSAVEFTIWSQDGNSLPEDVVQEIETALTKVKVDLFNKGHRLLSQVTRG